MLNRFFVSCWNYLRAIPVRRGTYILYMAVASGLAGPVLAGPVLARPVFSSSALTAHVRGFK